MPWCQWECGAPKLGAGGRVEASHIWTAGIRRNRGSGGATDQEGGIGATLNDHLNLPRIHRGRKVLRHLVLAPGVVNVLFTAAVVSKTRTGL